MTRLNRGVKIIIFRIMDSIRAPQWFFKTLVKTAFLLKMPVMVYFWTCQLRGWLFRMQKERLVECEAVELLGRQMQKISKICIFFSFSPCIEQVQRACIELEKQGFIKIETIEVVPRNLKV